MTLIDRFRKWLAAQPEAAQRPPMKINRALLASMPTGEERIPLQPYTPPEGVIPAGQHGAALAMDQTPYDYVNLAGFTGAFPGYPYLADLSQRPEYRKMVGRLADEMVRKWIELKSVGDEDKSDKIDALNAAMERYQVRDAFKTAAEHDGYFGRGQIYFDVKTPSGALATDSPDELESPLFLDPAKIKKGSLVALRNVEPVWTYPGAYQGTSPLKPNFYRPEKWFVMGSTIHHSRLAMFVSRPVPDILKAAYNFGGLSLSQIAEPYVNNWLRTRNSVSDLIHSFSLSILKTNMQTTLSGAADESLFLRADLFNKTRDNRGLMMVDKESEEIDQINTPLTGLHELQAQSQEHMSFVASIPLVILTGITPSGLNATSDGEIRVFYDYIHSQQEAVFRDPLKKVLEVIQLSEFGEIDPDITFEFVQLHELSEKERAEVRKTESETDGNYVDMGAISPEDVRQRLATDPDSQYHGLELSDEPTDPEGGGEDNGMASDSAFRESDHPRDEMGKFTDKGGSKNPAETQTGYPTASSSAAKISGSKVGGERLYHGTTPEALKSIIDEGGVLRGPVFLTPRKEVAGEYSDGGPVVELDIDPDSLKIDLDLPGARLLTVEEANHHLDNGGWSIDDYIEAGYSIGVEEDVEVYSKHLEELREEYEDEMD